jgi:hypothetical protein
MSGGSGDGGGVSGGRQVRSRRMRHMHRVMSAAACRMYRRSDGRRGIGSRRRTQWRRRRSRKSVASGEGVDVRHSRA